VADLFFCGRNKKRQASILWITIEWNFKDEIKHKAGICKGKRSVSAVMAFKLGRYFKTGLEIWTGLQAQFDLEIASRKLSATVARIHPCAAWAA
jgi:hypothetical protein